MRVVHGDLIDYIVSDKCDVIVHGCNCQHTMGRGVAAQIKSTFPEAYEADCRTSYNKLSKLGTVSFAVVEREDGSIMNIVNAYTQFHWRGTERKTNYDALLHCFDKIADMYAGLRIAYPRIGCGLGGGEWSVVAPIIDECLKGFDHVLVEKV